MSRPPKRREREKRDPGATRAALLRAGAKLFSERGFDGVSIEDLADHAAVNKALISYHFGGKRRLYRAVLESSFATMVDRLKAIEAAAPDTRQALRGLMQAFEALRRDHPDFPTLFLREVLSTGVEPSVIPHLVAIIGFSRRLAERGVHEGVFRRVDPLLLHFGLVGSLAFFFATEPARRKAVAEGLVPFEMPQPKAFLRYVEELTLRGLAPDRPAARGTGARA